MSERTETQIIIQEPLHASIGGKLVDIPIIKAGKSMEWRNEWGQAISEYQEKITRPESLQAQKATEADVTAAAMERLDEMLINSHDKVTKLVCSYVEKAGGEVTKEQILAEAWDAEIDALYQQICEAVLVPLAGSLASSIMPKKK